MILRASENSAILNYRQNTGALLGLLHHCSNTTESCQGQLCSLAGKMLDVGLVTQRHPRRWVPTADWGTQPSKGHLL